MKMIGEEKLTIWHNSLLLTRFKHTLYPQDDKKQSQRATTWFWGFGWEYNNKVFLAEFVEWEEGDMSYGVLMNMLEIEWKIEAEEESLIQRNFQRDRS